MCSSSAGAGDLAVLGDVADQEQRAAAPLGEADQLVRAGAQLGDRAGRRIDALDVHGLDRVDDHQARRVGVVEGRDDVADRGRRGEPHRRRGKAQAGGAQPDLIDRLLAADIGDRRAGRARAPRRPAAPASTCRCRDRRRSGSPSPRPGRRRAPGRAPRCRSPGAAGARARAAQPDQLERPPGRAQALGDRLWRRLLDQRVPFAAGIAAPRPFGVAGATAVADITGLGSGHADPMPRTGWPVGSTKQDFAAVATSNPPPASTCDRPCAGRRRACRPTRPPSDARCAPRPFASPD